MQGRKNAVAGIARVISKNEALTLVEDSLVTGLIITRHARDRMVERSISESQVRTILGKGEMVDPPRRSSDGTTKCKFEGTAAGCGIAVIVGFDIGDRGQVVVVVTTWEITGH